MNKNALIGIVVIGGLILVALILPKAPVEVRAPLPAEESEDSLVLPQELPADIPTYPNSQTQRSEESSSEEDLHFTLSLVTNDSISEINDWYREAFSSNGWSIKSDRNIGGYQIIQGENGNLYTSIQAASGSEAGEVVISQQVRISQQ